MTCVSVKNWSNHFLSRIKVQSRGPFWNNLFLFFLLFNLRWAVMYVSLVFLIFQSYLSTVVHQSNFESRSSRTLNKEKVSSGKRQRKRKRQKLKRRKRWQPVEVDSGKEHGMAGYTLLFLFPILDIWYLVWYGKALFFLYLQYLRI